MTEAENQIENEDKQIILIADDEASIRRILETRLKMIGYDVVTAADGEEAVSAFNKHNPDLVVLDIMMPKMDGYGVTREIRRTSDVPIIILTALGDVSERITGLELGADDYVVKPFSPKELMARVKAVINRVNPEIAESKERYIFGSLVIDVPSHSVRIDGENINLTPKEFDLLVCLVQNKGVALSRERILMKVWNYDYYGEDRTVDTHIKMLRGHLKDYRDCIVTVWGVGYKFEPKE